MFMSEIRSAFGQNSRLQTQQFLCVQKSLKYFANISIRSKHQLSWDSTIINLIILVYTAKTDGSKISNVTYKIQYSSSKNWAKWRIKLLMWSFSQLKVENIYVVSLSFRTSSWRLRLSMCELDSGSSDASSTRPCGSCSNVWANQALPLKTTVTPSSSTTSPVQRKDQLMWVTE